LEILELPIQFIRIKFFGGIFQRESLDFPQYHDFKYLGVREFEPFVLDGIRKDNFQL